MTVSPARVGRAVTARTAVTARREITARRAITACNDGAEGDHGAHEDGAQPVGDWLRYPVHGSNRTGPRGFSNSIGSM